MILAMSKNRNGNLSLFELIAHREIKSLLLTSNHPFSAWDAIFPDSVMTVAAVDRLVHHASIEIQAESFRKQAALQRSSYHDDNQPK